MYHVNQQLQVAVTAENNLLPCGSSEVLTVCDYCSLELCLQDRLSRQQQCLL